MDQGEPHSSTSPRTRSSALTAGLSLKKKMISVLKKIYWDREYPNSKKKKKKKNPKIYK
jgi:hypothetical protein